MSDEITAELKLTSEDVTDSRINHGEDDQLARLKDEEKCQCCRHHLKLQS